MPATTAELIDELRQHRLVDPPALTDVEGRFPDAASLLAELRRRDLLTGYQIEQILADRTANLRLGPYRILDWLGAGGMGQVYKAREDRLGRLVALKVIRPERAVNPDAVRRFHREIRAAARLDHPNIVHAHDADELAGNHVLVMEYVAGVDLHREVKTRGLLDPAIACEYARQVALGLQHAADRGLVHRDIKPGNLLLTSGGVVKILDFGLARLRATGSDGDGSTSVTREGVVMGSPDFIAPEQVMDAKRADIRADLYSLGCTLYFLLTARVPFPGGETMQKLMRHQLETPTPIESHKPDLSPAIIAIVRRLMAKKPTDRFQTPAEVVEALTAVADGSTLVIDRVPPDATEVDRALAGVPWDEVVTPPSTDEQAPRPQTRHAPWIWAIGGLVVLLGVAAIAYAIWGGHKPPENKVEPAPDGEQISIPPRVVTESPAEQWARNLRNMSAERQFDELTKELKRLNRGMEGLPKVRIEGNRILGLELFVDRVTDLTPIGALLHLRNLILRTEDGSTRLTDLSPLRGLRLTDFRCEHSPLADLSPLKGMPLEMLWVSYTNVSDLRPVADAPIRDLRFAVTKVTDLTPLRTMPLTTLHFHSTPVADLGPLRDRMDLNYLDAGNTKVTSVAPLAKLKALRWLSIGNCQGVTSLEPFAGLGLTELTISGIRATDLGPLRRVPLVALNCGGCPVTDFAPLGDAPLKELYCDFDLARDAKALRAIKTLERLNGKPVAEALRGK